MPFVSVTRLHLRSWRFLPQFVRHGSRSRKQAERADGVISVQTRKTKGLAFWTMTVWENERAMRQYMGSGAHKEAMPTLTDMCDEAASVHWTQPSLDPPNWEQAAEHLRKEGRLFSVKYPSSACTTGQISVD